MRRTRVKICGVATADEAALAVDAGADAVGVILAPSPRQVGIDRLHEIAQRIPALVTLVAVVVDAPRTLVDEVLETGAIPQFHGRESAEACEAFEAGSYLKAFHVRTDAPVEPDAFDRFARPYAHATWLFDTARPDGLSGGSGRTFSWSAARALAGDRPFVVSGGLTPENVGACVRAVRPFAVDVRSGVERDGVKDARLVRAFVDAVRAADADAS